MRKWLVLLLVVVLAASGVVGCDEEEEEGAVNAAFTASPTSGLPPLEVQFTDQSTGDPTAWDWDFDGDGTVDSTEQSPSHTYDTVGTYTVSLEVTGPEGSDTETKASYIEVLEELPPAVPTGTLTVAVFALPTQETWSPWHRSVSNHAPYHSVMGDHLVYITHDTREPIPGLAETWDIAADEMSITFYLREGVQFHDGWGELTSADVEFTIETYMGDQSEHGRGKTLFNLAIESIDTPGPYEITFNLEQPLASAFPSLMSQGDIVYTPIVCKDYIEEVGFEAALVNPIFSGPYQIVEFTVSERLVFEAVEDHWRLVPEYERLVFLEVPEEITRVAMLKRGDVDIAELTAVSGLPFEDEEEFEVIPLPDAYVFHLGLCGQYLPDNPNYDPDLPWLKKDVRKAMNLAIDKQAIADYILLGTAEPIGVFSASYPWIDEFPPYPFDPEQAVALLAAAGYGPGDVEVEMWVCIYSAQIPELSDMSMAIAGYWEDVGIEVRVRRFTGGEPWGLVIMRDASGTVFPMTNFAYFEPWQTTANTFFGSRATTPWYDDTDIDDIMDTLLASTSKAERDALHEDITELLYNEYAFVPLVSGDKTWVQSTEVGDWLPTAFSVTGFNWEYVTHSPALGCWRLVEP